MALVICCVPITEAIRLRISFKFAIFTKKVLLSVLYKSPQSYYFFGTFIGFFVKKFPLTVFLRLFLWCFLGILLARAATLRLCRLSAPAQTALWLLAPVPWFLAQSFGDQAP